MYNNIVDFLDTAPTLYKQMFNEGFLSPERTDYHPEAILGEHIKITINRAIQSGDINLLMIAALHDICKHLQPVKSKGGLKTITLKGGSQCTYHSNPDHAYQALKFIEENNEISQWILDEGADLDLVKQVVANHMNFKNYVRGIIGIKGGMKERKREVFKQRFTQKVFKHLIEFHHIDNMLKVYTPFVNAFKQ